MSDYPYRRKLILIVEDEEINRQILEMVLTDHYDLKSVPTGKEALEFIHANVDVLSVVLLDLNLPDINGLDILRKLKEDKLLPRVPVIVMTADKDAEVESLTIGAMDFIPKPYPRPEVIHARVRRTIELSEGRHIIGQTERDSLTGLYNREYFYSYAEQYDHLHRNTQMDAIVININHFHMINERYGKAYGDEVLKRIAEKTDLLTRERDGISCRREADNFLIYCPHQHDYTDMLEIISEGAAGEGKTDNIVRLRMGVYPRVDKTIDIERRFDRAKMAADTVRSTFTKAVAIYDSALHESAVFAEQLLIDFPKAIEEKQFLVYYQPKYDVRGEKPVLNSAEALVRWNHPEFGMISPGVFIPLFEKNGLVEQLDKYVWRTAAMQIRDWNNRLGISAPVSVNVSRVDMFDPCLLDEMKKLMEENGLTNSEFMLEVTESAYTQDSEHIIKTVDSLRKAGFFIEMDDFGSGYSSLNMLSNLPIDALKLDMQFIRTAFKNGKNTRMLEIVIDIAASLGVPVIAEGVETAEQLFTLKAMGCDIVQGYYFSKPVPPEKYEIFLLEKKADKTAPKKPRLRHERSLSHDRYTYEAMHDPLTGLYNSSAFDLLLYDADEQHAALLIAEVEGLNKIREEKGTEIADRVLQRAAAFIKERFRSNDFVFRIGDDEFAVIITRVDSSQRDTIFEKVLQTCNDLHKEEQDLGEVFLNVGLAFGDREEPTGNILQDADSALEKARTAREHGCVIY